MNFTFDEEHLELRDNFKSFLKAECPAAVVRAVTETGERAPRLWQQLAEIGVLDLLVPEERGGSGLDEIALVLLLEESGYVALPEPLVEHAAVAIPAIAETDAEIHTFIGGRETVVSAVAGQGPVGWAPWADSVVVGRDGGLALRAACPVISFDSPLDRSRPLGTFERAGPSKDIGGPDAEALAFDRGALATAAQLVGLGRRMLEMTLRHVTDRKQFGVPVGSFQAVKHHLADVRTALEYAAPLVYVAAYSVARREPWRALQVSMAKSSASDAAYRATRAALQCHGAMGYSEEYDLQLFMKRTWALSRSWGDGDWHRRRISEHLAKGAFCDHLTIGVSNDTTG